MNLMSSKLLKEGYIGDYIIGVIKGMLGVSTMAHVRYPASNFSPDKSLNLSE